MNGARRDGILPALVAVVVYAASLGNGFVYDDVPQILENPWLRSFRNVPDILTSHVWGFNPLHSPLYYRPAMHLVNLAIFQVAGPRPWAFHVVSVCLHAAVAVVIFRLVFRLLGGTQAAGARRGALIGSLIFAVHPVNAESVSWAGVLPDQLCALFSLLCVGSYVSSMSSGGRAQLKSLVWLAAALLSKETALVVPGLLIALEILRGGDDLRGIARRIAPSLVVAGAFLVLRSALLGGLLPAGALPPAGAAFGQMLRVLSALLHYAGKLVFPWPLSFVYEIRSLFGARDVLLAPGAWVLAAWAAVAVARRGQDRTAALSLVFFLVPLSPPLYAAVVMYPPLADRYLYLPSFGFALLCGWIGASRCAARVWDSRTGRALFAAGIVGAGAATALRTADFRSNLTLWTDTVAKTPASSLARGQLATALFADGQYEVGAREAREAIRLKPDNPDNHYNLGLASERQGLWNVAAKEYWRAIALGQADAEVLIHLASVLLSTGDTRGAAAQASRAVARDPANAEARYILGRARVTAGDYPGGAEELAAAVRLRPEETSWRRDAEQAARMATESRPPAAGQ